mgnify:CR=1 FL=1
MLPARPCAFQQWPSACGIQGVVLFFLMCSCTEEEEIILVNRNAFIHNIKNKRFKDLNGAAVKKYPDFNNEYGIIFGSSIKYYIDNMNEPIYTRTITKEDVKKRKIKDIPRLASNFYMGVWFSSNNKDRNFDIAKMYVDYFKYIPNNNQYTYL